MSFKHSKLTFAKLYYLFRRCCFFFVVVGELERQTYSGRANKNRLYSCRTPRRKRKKVSRTTRLQDFERLQKKKARELKGIHYLRAASFFLAPPFSRIIRSEGGAVILIFNQYACKDSSKSERERLARSSYNVIANQMRIFYKRRT